jgi:hypothetical protein
VPRELSHQHSPHVILPQPAPNEAEVKQGSLFKSLQYQQFSKLPIMDNLHAPTVPSGPTSAPLTNGTNTNRLSLAQLQTKKDNIEAEIRALSNVLDSVRLIIINPDIT